MNCKVIDRRARILAPIVAAMLALVATSAEPAEFRRNRAIATPSPEALPEGTRPVTEVKPVDTRVVRQRAKALFESYRFDSNALSGMLADSLNDKSRVLDNISGRIPRDAKLSVLGIQGIQTLQQFIEADPDTGLEVRTSRVSATVRGQIEFNDPGLGFVRRQGTAEYIFRVTEPLQ